MCWRLKIFHIFPLYWELWVFTMFCPVLETLSLSRFSLCWGLWVFKITHTVYFDFFHIFPCVGTLSLSEKTKVKGFPPTGDFEFERKNWRPTFCHFCPEKHTNPRSCHFFPGKDTNSRSLPLLPRKANAFTVHTYTFDSGQIRSVKDLSSCA